jgi:hypothetical protein
MRRLRSTASVVSGLALAEQRQELLEQQHAEGVVLRGAGEGDLVAAHVDVAGEHALDGAQDLVAAAQQGDHRLLGRDDDLADDAVDVRRRDGGVGHVVGGCRSPALVRGSWTPRGYPRRPDRTPARAEHPRTHRDPLAHR